MSAVSTRSQTGWSLVKGPVAIIGVLGIAFGVLGLIFAGHSFTTGSIPHGAIYGKRWLGIELNGWSNLLFIGAGLLLLLGSRIHWGAKTAAFIVAGVFGAAAVIAVIRGNGVFGIFAANHRTEIVWGGAAIVLVLLSMLPRVGGKSNRTQEPVGRGARTRDDAAVRDEPAAVRDEPVAGRDRVGRDQPVARDETVVRDQPVAHNGRDELVTREDRAVRSGPVAGDETVGAEQRVREQPATGDAPTTDAP